MWLERGQRDQYDTGTTAAAATSSAVFRVQDRCGPSQTLCVSVTTWHRGLQGLSSFVSSNQSIRESLKRIINRNTGARVVKRFRIV